MFLIHAPKADKGREKIHAAVNNHAEKLYLTACGLHVSSPKYEELPYDGRRIDCKKCKRILRIYN